MLGLFAALERSSGKCCNAIGRVCSSRRGYAGVSQILLVGASLTALQAHVRRCEVERGFAHQSAVEKCLLLGEEVGELFRSVRKASGIATDPESRIADVGEELADILNYVLAIANRFDVDLDEAFRDKERKNAVRSWR